MQSNVPDAGLLLKQGGVDVGEVRVGLKRQRVAYVQRRASRVKASAGAVTLRIFVEPGVQR